MTVTDVEYLAGVTRMASARIAYSRNTKMAKKKKPKKVKPRIPVAPPGRRHKTKKDYKREKKVDYRDHIDN